jgi:hypothetical protein
LFFATGLFLACTSEKDDAPENVLTEKQMKSVIKDVLIAKEMYVQKQKQMDSMHINPIESVFLKHNIDSTVFYNSLKYYLKHSETFLRIYKEIEQDVKHKMDSMDKTDQRNKRKDRKKSIKDKLPF